MTDLDEEAAYAAEQEDNVFQTIDSECKTFFFGLSSLSGNGKSSSGGYGKFECRYIDREQTRGVSDGFIAAFDCHDINYINLPHE